MCLWCRKNPVQSFERMSGINACHAITSATCNIWRHMFALLRNARPTIAQCCSSQTQFDKQDSQHLYFVQCPAGGGSGGVTASRGRCHTPTQAPGRLGTAPALRRPTTRGRWPGCRPPRRSVPSRLHQCKISRDVDGKSIAYPTSAWLFWEGPPLAELLTQGEGGRGERDTLYKEQG